MIFDRKTGKSKGYAFVLKMEDGDAQDCIKKVNGEKVDGHEIKKVEAATVHVLLLAKTKTRL